MATIYFIVMMISGFLKESATAVVTYRVLPDRPSEESIQRWLNHLNRCWLGPAYNVHYQIRGCRVEFEFQFREGCRSYLHAMSAWLGGQVVGTGGQARLQYSLAFV